MNVVKRFLLIHALWTAAIAALIVPLSLATVQGLAPAQYVRWFAHSVALATLPAGWIVGADVFRGRVWRNLVLLSAIEVFLMFFVFALLGFAAPMSGENVIFTMQRIAALADASWLQRNQLAWSVYMTVAECVSVPIYAGLGMMLGAWAEQVLPVTFRRLLFWAVSLKMVAFTYLITENSYEMLVIKTNGPAAFSAFFMLLIPLGMYGGLLLPSIGLARRAARAA
jgi:hypothetical protein